MDPYHSRLNVMSRLYVLVIQTSKIADETYLQTVTRPFFRVMEPTAVAECIRTLSRLRGKGSAITLLLFALENERRCVDECGLLQDLTALYHDSIVRYGILSDETRLEEVIRPLINRMPLELAAECLLRIIADCAQCSVEVLRGRSGMPAEFQPNDQLLNIALDILVKFRHRLSDTQLRHRLCLVNLVCQLYPRLVAPSHSLIQNMWASFMICSGQEGINQGLNFLFTLQLTAGTSLAAIQYVIAFAKHTMHQSPTRSYSIHQIIYDCMHYGMLDW
ncbi:hypothetical protein SERLA73DRAFT_181076 [Serpula lacrymans var. lacrymans S7.3]|uniref:Uncharacterized protein n=2 Tax=Serpula lacrymans var. lacrymans TaxID=341189 RepID=F8PUR1_SERL3|nr:uncharacterized protein SERLADRAFT_466955 [Serpula lacrymans var. lacrymans S7.9]EGO00469.1 hypothetical protein SERLA73DRAFT_181076 [Serpula lacrymans var. lacrymans S7.3]EGO26021.1 hypothetical protein SERLADRAFT_466955 [Serpula lacrymans var. lacrymans S7.9]